MLRGRSFYNAAVTWYKSDIPYLRGGYAPLPWLHTPRLRLRVTTVAEDIWVHILLVGVVYPILVVSIAVVDSATWFRVSTRIYGQPLRLVVVCLPPPAVEHHPLEALVTLQGKKDGKYICTCTCSSVVCPEFSKWGLQSY